MEREDIAEKFVSVLVMRFFAEKTSAKVMRFLLREFSSVHL